MGYSTHPTPVFWVFAIFLVHFLVYFNYVRSGNRGNRHIFYVAINHFKAALEKNNYVAK